MSDNYYARKTVNGSVVEKILEQGQRLRNAMIESILKNDPLNSEILFDKHYNTPVCSNIDLCSMRNLSDDPKVDDEKLDAFLKGDQMSKDDEILALETLRSMSASDLCKTTNRTYRSSQFKCNCSTCKAYDTNDLKCDLRRLDLEPENKITKQIQEQYRSENEPFLQYVDCLKVSVHSLVLNEAGNRRMVPLSNNSNSTYFLEYQIPQALINKTSRTKSKVDSGLDSNNVVRICTRRKSNEALTFKQQFVHDISNIDKINLENVKIKFQISSRSGSKNTSTSIGCATFNFSAFEVTKNLTCNRGLILELNENVPIELGVLKVSLQLGCGRLYFGKEFLEAINLNKRKSIVLDSDDSSSNNTALPLSTIRVENAIEKLKEPIKVAPKPKPVERKVNKENVRETVSNSAYFTSKTTAVKLPSKPNLTEAKHEILFGFMYISEAQYLSEPVNTYITCRPFCQANNSYSRLFNNTANPVFNFCQIVPLIFDDDFLLQLRENYIIIEFWKKVNSRNTVFGIAKVSLHQFYLAYRNPIIVKYLKQNKLPTVGTDWWEPISTPIDEEVVGQVQVLIALGTKEQIDYLENERGFKNHIVKAKFPQLLPTPRTPTKNAKPKPLIKIDVAVQSDSKMEPKPSQPLTEEMLGSIFNQFLAQKQSELVDSSTNTEQSNVDNSNKKTVDLLESLEKALTVEQPIPLRIDPTTFKAHVIIDSALHLPSRKKCKSKKTKNKGSSKGDDNILPCTYVTFETLKGQLTFTEIVSKSTRPQWNFRVDVVFPVELLTNTQSRLIFKVWRKSTSTVKQPNLDADIVVGFAAIDLTVLLAGLPNVQGWFNIVDFSGKCNGQINIHVTPLEDLSRFHAQKDHCANPTASVSTNQNELVEEPGESLSRALKRKFSELDEITQRLRLRLSKVTNDDSDNSNDEIADEFESDINTLCIEEDFNLINFAEEDKDKESQTSKAALDNINSLVLSIANEGASGSTSNTSLMEVMTSSSSNAEQVQLSELPKISSLDRHLFEGKQRIDTLLEKLTLMSGEAASQPFSNRYVSGCSISNEPNSNIDTEAILNELDHFSRPNIQSQSGCNFDELFNNEDSTSSSASDCRAAPDGQGNVTTEKKSSN